MKVLVLSFALLVIAAGIGSGDPVSAEARDLAFALGLYRDGQYRLAEEELASFVERYPQSVSHDRTQLLRADCLVELRQYEEAFARARALTALPGSLGARAHLVMGRALVGLDRIEEAERALTESVRTAGEPEIRAEALHFLGWTMRHRGACQEALPLFEEAAALEWPGRRSSALQVVWCSLELGDAESAEERAADLLAEGPPSPLREEAQVARGVALLALNRGAGVPLLEDALRADLPPAVIQAGEIALAEWVDARGQLRDAEQWYRSAAVRRGQGGGRALAGLGWCLFDMGRPAQADSAFALLIARYPGDELAAEAWYGRGKALLGRGDQAGAGRAFEEVVREHTSSEYAGPARWELAAQALEAGRWEDVDAHLGALLSGDMPTWLHGQVLALASEAAFRRGDYSDAIVSGQGALSDSLPADVRRSTELRLAISLVQEDRAAEAAVVLDPLSRVWPVGQVWLWLGEALFQSGDFERAADAYGKALESGTEEQGERARYGRAWAWLKLGRWEEAEAEFAVLAETSPMGEEALLRQGDALFNQKRYAEAAGAYGRVASSAADSILVREALLRLATAQVRSHELDESLTTLARLLEDPGSLSDDALMLQGDVLFQQGRYDEAASVYDDVIALCRDRDLRARAHYRLGDAYYNQGLYERAARTYGRFLMAFPGHELLVHAADGFLRSLARGRGGEAAVRAADSLSASPDSVIRAAAAHARAGFFAEEDADSTAAAAYERAAALFPWSSWADNDLLSAAQMHATLGRDDDALRLYRELRRLYPASELVPQALYSEAELQADRGEDEQAVRLLQELRAVAVESELVPPALLLEAWIQRDLGRLADAQAVLTQLLAAQPSGELEARARLELSEIALEEQRWSDGRRWAAWVVEQRSDALAAKAQRLMAESFAGEGDWDKAHREFLRVTYLYPSATHEVELAKQRAAECEAQLEKP
jgi:TolA-binding protein